MKVNFILSLFIVRLVLPACSDFTSQTLCNAAWSCFYGSFTCSPSTCYDSHPGETYTTCGTNCAQVSRQDGSLRGTLCYNSTQHPLPANTNQYYCSEYYGIFGVCTLSGCAMYKGECFSEGVIPTTCSTLCNSCGNAEDCERKTDCYWNSNQCYNTSICRSTTCDTCVTSASCSGKDSACKWNDNHCYNSSTSCSSSGEDTLCSSCPTSSSCTTNGNTNCYYYSNSCYDSRTTCQGATTCGSCTDTECSKRNDCISSGGSCVDLDCTGGTCTTCAHSAACLQLGGQSQCFWDSTLNTCFNYSCTSNQCSSCHTTQSCDGYPESPGCFWKDSDSSCHNKSTECPSDCHSCGMEACPLKTGCYLNSIFCYNSSDSCNDGQVYCGGCDTTACALRQDCVWSTVSNQCGDKVCIGDMCGSCGSEPSCRGLGKCYWNTTDWTCQDSFCDDTLGNDCNACPNAGSCATKTDCAWAEPGLCFNTSVACRGIEGCTNCVDATTCNQVTGCEWIADDSNCYNITCSSTSCSSCSHAGSCGRMAGCKWDAQNRYCAEQSNGSRSLGPSRLLFATVVSVLFAFVATLWV